VSSCNAAAMAKQSESNSSRRKYTYSMKEVLHMPADSDEELSDVEFPSDTD